VLVELSVSTVGMRGWRLGCCLWLHGDSVLELLYRVMSGYGLFYR
jgi:hypothetical protein